MNWKYVSENPLGVKNADGRWVIFEGYENTRLFAIKLASGFCEYFVGWIDDDGSVCHQDSGDPCGWEWDSVYAYCDIEEPRKESEG